MRFTRQNTYQTVLRIYSLFIAAIALTGCQTLMESNNPAPTRDVSNTRSQLPITVENVIKLLEIGKSSQALSMLNRIHQQGKKTKVSQRLYEQLTQSPTQRYGKQSFPYTIKRGDSLALIAKRYLGHSLEFYGLGRFNNISDPRQLRVGQTIQVPGKNPKKTIKKKADNQLFDEVNQLITEEKYESAFRSIANDNRATHSRSLAKRTAQKSLTFWIDSAQTIDELISIKKSIKSISINNDFLKPVSVERLKYLEFRLLLFQSRVALDTGNDSLAYSKFSSAFELSFELNEFGNQLKKDLCDSLHRRAVLYFRSQELERAIHLWDQILLINPQYEQAQIYRTRATKLHVKLKGID